MMRDERKKYRKKHALKNEKRFFTERVKNLISREIHFLYFLSECAMLDSDPGPIPLNFQDKIVHLGHHNL